MSAIADNESNLGRNVICDFVCPTNKTRKVFKADITIWVDTIKEGRYEDTNKMFEPPVTVDFHVTKHLIEEDGEVENLANAIISLSLYDEGILTHV